MKGLIPWRKREQRIANFRKEYDDLFSRFFDDAPFAFPKRFSEESWYPTMDMSEGEKDIIIKAEIHGVEQKDIEVSLDGRILTIKGEKKLEKEESDERYHRVESHFGSYKRTIELPADVDESKVEARYKNGVLKINLKKAKAAATRKIKIATGK